MNVLVRHILLVSAVSCIGLLAAAESVEQPPVAKHVYEYREITGEATYLSTNAVDTLRNHLHVHNEDRVSVDDYLIDTVSHECVRWIYLPHSESIRLLVVRDGQSLRLNGARRGGKALQRTEKLGAAPWAQEWMSFLGALALSKNPGATFCSLVPPTFDLVTFYGKVLGEESVFIDGSMVPAVHIRVSFSGKLRIAWHGDYWFRSRDGRFVRFSGSILPGFPSSVFELVEKGYSPPTPHQKRKSR